MTSPETIHVRCFGALAAFAVSFLGCLLGCSQSDEPEHPGKGVYERYCYACHQAGIADAPKLGDREAWAPRLAKPREELLENIERGMTPGMPPRGGCPSCTDEALAAALDYIVLKAE
ncbi:MAG: cytochrome c5 family protein [Pseudomonadales bacterium]|nr:cytochrome c5 family protein [Pseudomonadales bacterium]